MASPSEMNQVHQDAKLVDRDVTDVIDLCERWFKDLQDWLDHDEYEALSVEEAAGYKMRISKMAVLLGKK